MKNALDVRPTFKLNNDSLPAGTVLHDPLRLVHDAEPEPEDREPLSEFVVWMIFLAYLAVILTVSYLLRVHFMSS